MHIILKFYYRLSTVEASCTLLPPPPLLPLFSLISPSSFTLSISLSLPLSVCASVCKVSCFYLQSSVQPSASLSPPLQLVLCCVSPPQV